MNGPLQDRNEESEDTRNAIHPLLPARQDGDEDRSLELAGSDYLLGC